MAAGHCVGAFRFRVPAVAGSHRWAVDLAFTVVCASMGLLIALGDVGLEASSRHPAGAAGVDGSGDARGVSLGTHALAWLAQIPYGAIGLRMDWASPGPA